MSTKTIQHIISAQKVNMGGHIIDQPLPAKKLDQLDPFLLIHHWKNKLPGNQKQQDLGVGPHPHRGFSPVTVVFEGAVHHRDSRGNDEVVSAGGTQWMNSGSGIVHSERPSKELAENGGLFEFIQFWVNSPAKAKMQTPSYQSASEATTPCIYSKDQKIKLSLISGNYGELKGTIKATSDLLIARLDGKAGDKLSINVNKAHNTLIYILEGEVRINDQAEVPAKDMVVFNPDGDLIKIECINNFRGLILSGQPIKEPLAIYGPFVMNKQSQIVEAINEFQSGKFGHLEEKFT